MAVVMTWPVVTGLGTAIAGDLADPAFNTWVLLWTSGQVLAFLAGDWGALGRYWHGNIFHPESNTLAYSEHLTPQMLQALPVIALTDNVLVAYNLLFLSTFVLCGLGVYLFVRDLTGHPLAAFVAGLAFAWAPYRLAHISHLQILSSHWMPLALVGFQRYFATRRRLPLAGGTSALVLQNLSCGYFLLYFPPFLGAYCLYEMTRRRLLGQWRVWLGLAAAALTAALVTWPFVEPYLAIRAGGELGVRSAGEIRMFSADVWSLATAPPNLRLWDGRVSMMPKAEGEGFPGLTIAVLAVVAIVCGAWRGGRSLAGRPMPVAVRTGAAVAAIVLAVAGSVGLWIAIAGGLRLRLGGTLFIHYSPVPALSIALGAALVLAGLLALTPRERAESPPWPVLFFACAFVAAVFLSFGPVVTSGGRVLMTGPYALLQAWIPGYDGSRVPARFLMLSALFLSVLAGLGAAALARMLPRRLGAAALVVAATFILAESWIAPFRTNVQPGVPPPLVAPSELRPGRSASPLYRVIRALPDPVVLIAFPFGEPAHDIHAMFYAGHHRRALVNGYSGFFPPSFQRRVGYLWNPTEDPARASAWLDETGATHALVHEAFFADDVGPAVSAWLESRGARLMTSDGSDRLYQLK